jgi:hypothetical protein
MYNEIISISITTIMVIPRLSETSVLSIVLQIHSAISLPKEPIAIKTIAIKTLIKVVNINPPSGLVFYNLVIQIKFN